MRTPASSRRISVEAVLCTRLGGAPAIISSAQRADGQRRSVCTRQIHLCHKTGLAPPGNKTASRARVYSRERLGPPRAGNRSMVEKANSARAMDLRQRTTQTALQQIERPSAPPAAVAPRDDVVPQPRRCPATA